MSSPSAERIIEEFSEFGINLHDNGWVDRLAEYCALYGKSADDMLYEWLAYSHSHGNCAVNLDTLNSFERERLIKETGISKNASKTPTNRMTPHLVDEEEMEEEGILDCYTPQTLRVKKRQLTPDQRLIKRPKPPSIMQYSPTSFSPASATPSKSYGERKNGGQVVATFGSCSNVTWKSQREASCIIAPYDPSIYLSQPFHYMFQKLADKAQVLNDAIEDLANQIKEKHGLDDFWHVSLPNQETVVVAGRIACDGAGRMNAQSVILEGSRETSSGRSVPLSLADLPSYSLFPGQIVAVEGINSNGTSFVAKKIYEAEPPSLPKTAPRLEKGDIHMVVAVGPFHLSDSFSFEPLADLVQLLQKNAPDVCILMGPFLDVRNADLEKNLVNESFEVFFKKTIERVTNAVQSTQFIIVPSQRDVHHDFVYPQPPFAFNKKDSSIDHQRIHFVPDPCILKIDDVIVALTSTDILFHLGAEEISKAPGLFERLPRLTKHILTQQSFYPLSPPSEDVNIDYEYFEANAKLPVMPHILILPSDLKYFVKDVCGCFCINPGRLAKGQVGGTYTRIRIQANQNQSNSLIDSIAAEIVRI